MNVPFVDVKRINARFQAEFDSAFARVSRSGRYLFGAETEAFELEFAQMCGARHCVGVASGLDALALTLESWISLGELSAGDKVIVPANSFVASAVAVTRSGLRVQFADVDPHTFNLSIDTVRAALDSAVRAIMPVDLYGQLAPMMELRALCKERGILIIEDAAQAHGAHEDDSHPSIVGDAAGFSFYPAKNLGAFGDAGCVVTNDTRLAQRIRTLGNYGSTRKYEHDFRGTNSRLDELQAALLRVRLSHLKEDNAIRRSIAQRYRDAIAHPLVMLPTPPGRSSSHVWHLFVVTTPRRDDLARHLSSKGIETIVHYPCAINAQPAFRDEFGSLPLPVSSRLQHEVLSLPISPVLDRDQVDYVIESVNNWPLLSRALATKSANS